VTLISVSTVDPANRHTLVEVLIEATEQVVSQRESRSHASNQLGATSTASTVGGYSSRTPHRGSVTGEAPSRSQ
jgi:hypothetical protein